MGEWAHISNMKFEQKSISEHIYTDDFILQWTNRTYSSLYTGVHHLHLLFILPCSAQTALIL